MSVEGWTFDHDDKHRDGQLLRAAMLYLGHERKTVSYRDGVPVSWPWEPKWWKPKDRERNLVRAGALMLAERDRLTRLKYPVGHVDHKLNIVINMLAALRRPSHTQGAEAMREAAASIVEGRVFEERYREWPQWGSGNRSNDSEIVRLCDALAAAIRALPVPASADGWRPGARWTKGPPVEIRPNDDGSIDEIVLRGAWVHIEQMSPDGWYMGVDDSDGRHWQFWFGTKNRKSAVEFRHVEGPDASPRGFDAC